MKISEFSQIRMGHGFRERLSEVRDGTIRVIQPKNISSEGLISFGREEPLRSDVLATKPLEPKDVLLVNRGRFAAAVFDLPDSEGWIVPSSVLILSLKTNSVLPEYVACYLNSASGKALLQRHCEQTTVSFISAGNLGNIDIPVPPLDQQRALVAFDQAASQYTRLSNRKQELVRQILNHELMNVGSSLKGSAP